MYPNLYFFLKQVFGIELQGFKLINTFGFMVALAFLSAAWALTSELKRRQKLGVLQYSEQEIWVGKGANWGDVLWNALFGFIMGWKFIGFFSMRDAAYADPQAFLLSGMGNLSAGIILALVFGGLRYYSGNKTKLAKPEKRIIRIWPHDRVGDMIILAAVFGFGGAKLFHNLENWEDLVADPINALISFSGLTFYGGLICAGAAIVWYARKHRINLWHLVDSFGPALMLAYAIGRIGCQVAGDGDWGIVNSAYVSDMQGKAVLATPQQYNDSVTHYLSHFKRSQHGVKEVTTAADVLHAPFKAPSFLPTWMVAYTYPNNVLSDGVPLPECEGQWCNRLPMPVYPTPFYETVMGLLLFSLLWAYRKKLKVAGQLFGFYLIGNGLERFLVEKIRVNTTTPLLGFHPSQAEIISLCLILAGIIIILIRRKADKIPEPAKS
ncbi:MAG TPA: prolipoprotein diacylglyceryl transferase family protein [Phnomibacter sp.]|nr:prolipoprotein diacylglyceryl transferase family protein [Phnomibacter sp.]